MFNLISNKTNRKIYAHLLEATTKGLRRIGEKYKVIDKVPKTHDHKIDIADINIALNGAPSKIGKFFNKSRRSKKKFCTLQVGEWDSNGIISLDDRDRYRDGPYRDDIPIFCNFFDKDYVHHFYKRGRLEARKILSGVKIEDWVGPGEYVLIPEQVQPEGMHKDIKGTRQGFEKWLKETTNFLKFHWGKDIIIRSHPHRTKWKFIKDQSLKGIYKLSEGNSLEHDLSAAQCVITASSKLAVHAVLAGVPSWSLDQNSIGRDIFSPSVKETIQQVKPLVSREQWHKDISWSYWTLGEIASGDYFKFMLEELV